MRSDFELVPVGRFNLSESIGFGFGQRESSDESVMRLAFVLDGYEQQVGVAVRQSPAGVVGLTVTGSDDWAAVSRHVSRVLSIDVDARGWDELGDADELIGAVQQARPGLRPPLFYSAYEALAWSVLSARRPRAQMAALRDRLAAAFGAEILVAGEPIYAMPTPRQLLGVKDFPGLDETKLRRLHGVAQAAVDGELDTASLRGLDPAEAAERVQRLEGIGPFYSALVVIRTLGHTDVLVDNEPQIRKLAGELTGAGRPLTDGELGALADSWRPWRTWATVAIRAAGPGLLDS